MELRTGPWEDALAHVEMVDAVITDPPYGARTHDVDLSALDRAQHSYAAWTEADVHAFVDAWSPRTRGWMACMTSHDLWFAWEEAYARHSRKVFAPVPCCQHRPRLAGDGPGSGTVFLMVARPRAKEWLKWGSLASRYLGNVVRGAPTHGAKPVEMMLRVVQDYSRPGALVVDPCAGGGSTLVSCALTGRVGIGAEVDADTAKKAIPWMAAQRDRFLVEELKIEEAAALLNMPAGELSKAQVRGRLSTPRVGRVLIHEARALAKALAASQEAA